MNGSPTEKGSKLEQLAKDLRTRKGLKPDVPTVDAFYGACFFFCPDFLLVVVS